MNSHLNAFLNNIINVIPFSNIEETMHNLSNIGFQQIQSKDLEFTKYYKNNNDYYERKKFTISLWQQYFGKTYYIIKSFGSGYLPSCAFSKGVNEFISTDINCFMTTYCHDNTFKYILSIMEYVLDNISILVFITENSYLLLYEKFDNVYEIYDKGLLKNALLTQNYDVVNYLANNNDQEVDLETLGLILNSNDNIFNIFTTGVRYTLHTASRYGYNDFLLRLLQNGADSNRQNRQSWTALVTAVENGHYSTVELLLHYGADPNIVSGGDVYPIHESVSMKRIDITMLLLEKGANPNLMRPLVYAAKQNDFEMTKLLLENGADPNVQFDFATFRSALSIAKENKNNDIIMLLKQYGAFMESGRERIFPLKKI